MNVVTVLLVYSCTFKYFKVVKNNCNDVTFCMLIVRIEQLSRLDCFLINMVDNFIKVKPYNQLDMLNITNHHCKLQRLWK